MEGIKIEEIKILRGPNYWSCYRKDLIQMKIDLGKYEDLPSNKLDGFADQLEKLMPSLYEHECSEGKPGGFFERVREGTWLGHIAEHVALELQSLAGMDCGFGRTRSRAESGKYHLVFAFVVEEAGVYAGKAAIHIVESLAHNQTPDIAGVINDLRQIYDRHRPGPALEALIKIAKEKDIPYQITRGNSLLLGQGKYQKHIVGGMALAKENGSAETYFFNPEESVEQEAEQFIQRLFPGSAPSRIPIIAITGTNGKTTTTRLIAHIAKEAGYNTGLAITDGIFINGEQIDKGDCSGPSSARKVLSNPLVDFAVLECARGGILRSGLGFDKCDTSVVTNVTDDHLGLDDVEDLDDLANVKSVVAQSTSEDGFAILNADDDRVYKMKKGLDCKVALFSLYRDNERVLDHCAKGELAAFVEEGYFVICDGRNKQKVAKVIDVPLTMQGKLECMIQNTLAAILASFTRNVPLTSIVSGIKCFVPGPEMTPGRFNIFSFGNFSVMVDYAHNCDGFRHLKKFLDKTNAGVKVGIITSPGDRRDEDMINIGAMAAETFDEIIIRHDADLRGRTKDEITRLIKKGIESVDPSIPVTVVSDEIESIQFAIDNAKYDSMIVVCTEKIDETLQFLTWAMEPESERLTKAN